MKFLTNLGVLLLNLICLSPVVACMAPDVQMSAAERACCQIMKNECGQMQMPASHGCCQKYLPTLPWLPSTGRLPYYPAVTDFVTRMATDLADRQTFSPN